LAKEVLAKIMAYDPYYANPSESMVMAWAQHISMKNPDREDMLTAVDRFYESPPKEKPLAPHITTLAREVRLERTQVGSDAWRARQEAIADAKAEGREFNERELTAGTAEKISRQEWEQRSGEKFPDATFTKPIPTYEEHQRPSVPGSGHRCAIPAKVPKAGTWECHDGHEQEWMVYQGRWIMCESAHAWLCTNCGRQMPHTDCYEQQ
jgi:hypothetical protein